MDFIIQPLKSWAQGKTENKDQRYSQFRQTYSDTKKILADELEKANIHGSPILKMWISSEQLTKDGTRLRADCQPFKPGVILSFTRIVRSYRDPETQQWKHVTKTVSYPCDAFSGWQDNLRAIALSLQKLRQVERYGVFSFTDLIDRMALPEGSATEPEKARQAAGFLCQIVGNGSDLTAVLKDQTSAKKLYENARRKAHPDAGGSDENFIQVQAAWKDLQSYFGEAAK